MIRRIAIAAATVVASVAAVVTMGASGSEKGQIFKVELDNAFGLTQGGDFRIGGVKAGRTTDFGITAPEGTEPVRALVSFEITNPGFQSLRSDASCQVRQQSLIGEYYVDCQPGSDDEELADGATIPVEQTESIIPVDLVQNVLRDPYKQRLRLIIAELGTGLAGRPDDLSEALRRAHPGLRETSKTLQILGEQRQTLKDFVANSDTVVADLAANKTNVSRFVREAGETAEISASRSEDLAGGFQRLPGFLQQLSPYMVSLGNVADEQIPLLADLRTASGDLEQFFRELGPFSEASRPALRSLGETSVIGEKALDVSRDEVRDLLALSGPANKLSTPLRQLLVSLDDRGRATARDERAVATAPPRSDPTGKGTGRGFTGFESITNYAFWQTLAINGYDEVSHFLRILGVDDECSDYNVDPTREQIEMCSTYLGPYQPGIKNASGVINGRDFGPADSGKVSDFGGRAVNKREGGSKGSTKNDDNAKRSAAPEDASASLGGPQAGLSGPRAGVTGIGDVLRGLGEQVVPGRGGESSPGGQGPSSGGQAPDQLLDFLLGP